jgi:hydrogenase small subunit
MQHADGTAPVGLALTSKSSVLQVAEAIGKTKRPSVIWLHFQDCTGCTETLLRTSAPDVAHLILDVISLDYHETLMAASGAQAEAALRSAMADNAGKYVLVVEGAIPTRDDGVYMEWAAGRRSGPERSCRPGGRGDRHRLLRLLGRCALGRPQSHGRGRE